LFYYLILSIRRNGANLSRKKTVIGISLNGIALGGIAFFAASHNPAVRVITFDERGSSVTETMVSATTPGKTLSKTVAEVSSEVASRFAGLKDFVFTETEKSASADEGSRGVGRRTGGTAKESFLFEMNGNPPASFVKKYGERAGQLWKEIEKEPLESAERHSLGLFVEGNSKKESTKKENQEPLGAAEASIPSGVVATGSRLEEPKSAKTLTWKFLDKCPAPPPARSGITDASPPGELPPTLSGFLLAVFDEHRNVLKKSFVPVLKVDPYGCQQYQKPLGSVLPDNVPVESFVGYVSVSALTLKSIETGQPIWRNFSTPQSLALEEARGTGSIKIEWDRALVRDDRTTLIDQKEIAYYRMYYGRESHKYTHVSEVHCGETTCLFHPTNLELGQWYLVMTTVDSNNVESTRYSEEIPFVAK